MHARQEIPLIGFAIERQEAICEKRYAASGCFLKRCFLNEMRPPGVRVDPSINEPTNLRLLMLPSDGVDARDDEWTRFKELLDEQNDWPARYTFKFIAPSSQLDELKAVFGDHPVRVRASSKGNYKSVTAHLRMESSDDVIDIYVEASEVEGVISL